MQRRPPRGQQQRDDWSSPGREYVKFGTCPSRPGFVSSSVPQWHRAPKKAPMHGLGWFSAKWKEKMSGEREKSGKGRGRDPKKSLHCCGWNLWRHVYESAIWGGPKILLFVEILINFLMFDFGENFRFYNLILS